MDPYIGQIQLFPFNFAPVGWLLCDGSSLPVASYQALYSLIGTNFGGNGTTTFQIPDLRNSNPLDSTNQMKYYIAVNGMYPTRS